MNPLTNPTNRGRRRAGRGWPDPLDALLRQIINGFFVLTDGQGSVSKWSEPAELLFAQPADAILGQGFFETLIGGALPPAGQAWREFLDAGEPPRVPGSVELTGRRSDGDDVPAGGRLRPGQARRGLRLLALPRGPVLRAAAEPDAAAHAPAAPGRRPRAEVGARARRAAVGGLAHRRHAGRLPAAGRDAVGGGRARAPRGRARRSPDAETEERLTNTDPGIQGDCQRPRRRRRGRRAPAERDGAHRRARARRRRPARPARRGAPRGRERAAEADRRGAARRRPAGAGRRAERARPPRAAERRLERLERRGRRRAGRVAEAAAARVAARLDAAGARGAAAADARLADGDRGRRGARGRGDRRSARRFEARLAGATSPPSSRRCAPSTRRPRTPIRTELAATLERLERDREREREAARAELAAALERVEQVQRGADAVREQLRAARPTTASTPWPRRPRRCASRVADLATADQLAELRQSLGVDLAGLRQAVADNGDAVEVAAGCGAPSDLDSIRAALAALRDVQAQTASEVAALRETVARHEAARELREAVARHEAATADLAALREAVARHEAARRRARRAARGRARPSRAARRRRAPRGRDARTSARCATRADLPRCATPRRADDALREPRRLPALRDASRATRPRPRDLPALRDTVRGFDALRAAVARHEAAAGEVAVLRDIVSAHAAATSDLAARAGDPEALRQLGERQAAAANEVAALRDAVQRQEAAAADVVALRHRQDGLAGELEQLRAQLGAATGQAPEQAAVESRVQTLVGDTQREIAALHARLAALGDDRELGELRARVDDLAERTGAIDFLARADDVAALGERVDRAAAARRSTTLQRAPRADTRSQRRLARASPRATKSLAEPRGLAAATSSRRLSHARRSRPATSRARERRARRARGLARRCSPAATKWPRCASGSTASPARDELAARLDGLVGRDELAPCASGSRPRRARRPARRPRRARDELADRTARRPRRASASTGSRRATSSPRCASGSTASPRATSSPRCGTTALRERPRRAATSSPVSPGATKSPRCASGSTASRPSAATSWRRCVRSSTGSPATRISPRSPGATRSTRCGSGSVRSAVCGVGSTRRWSGSRRSIVAPAPCWPTCARSAGRSPRRSRRRSARARPPSSPARPRTRLVRTRRAPPRKSPPTRRDVEAHAARTALLSDHVTSARSDASAARAATDGLDSRLASIDQRAAALRGELDTVGHQVDRLGGTVVDTGIGAQERDRRRSRRARRPALGTRHPPRGGQARRRPDRGDAVRAAVRAQEPRRAQAGPELRRAGGRDRPPRGRAGAQGRARSDGSTERVTEVFQQILGLAAQRNAQTRRPQPARPLTRPRAEPVKREQRHGFDDAHAPMAILALNGKFKELNPAFTKLVGYKEHEFMKAAWPSPHDRKDYKDQLEQLRRIGAGELHAGRGHEHVHARPGPDGPGCRNADARHGRRRRPVAPRARGRRPRHGVTPSAGASLALPTGRCP